MPGRMEFQLNLPKSAANPVRRDHGAPLRLLIMADFSGRADRETPGPLADLASRPLLTVDVDSLDAVMARLAPKLRDGTLVISAAEHRSQLQNRRAAENRLATLLRDALAPPPKRRRPTRPSRAAKERRLETKKRRGRTKSLRRYGGRGRDAE